MSTIEVCDGTDTRPARSGPYVSSGRILSLLGFGPPPAASPAAAIPLGDALATVALSIGFSPPIAVLACAEVAEVAEVAESAVGRSVGDVQKSGDVGDLAKTLRGGAPRIAVVADGRQPSDSMAEQLRLEPGVGSAESVIGVLSLGEACERLFDFRNQALAGTLVTNDCREAARGALFEQTLNESRLVLEWRVVSALAIGLLRHADPEDAPARFELELVRDIAWRHDGYPAPIDWPEPKALAAYDETRRLRLLTHVVQSASDGDITRVSDYVRRATEALQGNEGDDALKLRGAIGRALAAIGHFEDAIDLLHEAVDAWLKRRPSEASYSLCELLRLEGILGRAERIKQLKTIAEREVIPVLSTESRPFVYLALGRALTQTGATQDAVAMLNVEELYGRAPQHVVTAARRWKAVAARQLGDHAGARAAMDALAVFQDSDQLWLARLDAGSTTTNDTLECLNGLVAARDSQGEARRLLDRIAPGLSLRAVAERPDTLRRLRAEYRY